MGEFIGKLRLDLKVGSDKLHVARDFQYVTKSGWDITVPQGMPTDLASIPKGLRWLISKVEKHMPAALVHDYLYSIEHEPRKEADKVFLEAMEDCGVSWWKRRAMYRAVRSLGWVNY